MQVRKRGEQHGHPRQEPGSGILRLFVYGTLKRGFHNHDAFCRNPLNLEEARIRGRLFEGPGYPFLVVPDEDILARGTTVPGDDVATQWRVAQRLLPPARPARPAVGEGAWGTVHGELLSLDDPDRRLPAIDRLEGFHPGDQCHYHRVLVRVTARGATQVGWTYVAARSMLGRRWIRSGCWPE